MEHSAMNTTLCARVMGRQGACLRVCDCDTRQEILVHTDQACCFSCGDLVQIEFSGAMTMSLPPQISAICISRAGCC